MTTYRKKLIEVALPLKAINEASAREKSIRHGHPSTLHLWWARRPLAACRAVLFASLVDDPDSDPQYRKLDGTVDEDTAGIKRADLFNLIEELVQWENSNNADVIRTARAEIARCVASRKIETGELQKDSIVGGTTTAYDLVVRCHCRPIALGLDKKAGRVRFSFDVSRLPPAEVVNAFLAEHAPPVLDPFAGGGSIPLEAQRLGLRAYASDLNPVPVLINKALIEIPPKFAGRPPVNPEARSEGAATKGKGKKSKSLIAKEWPGATGLADDVRYYGKWMRDEAEKRIGHLYPKVEVTEEMAKDQPGLLPYVSQKLTVIAWLWARTVSSPDPSAKGARVPLVRSFWLSTKKGKEVWIEPEVDRSENAYVFRVKSGKPSATFDPGKGTIGRNADICLITGSTLPRAHIRAEGIAGRLGQRLLAIVAEGSGERLFVSPLREHETTSSDIQPGWTPDTEIPNTRYTTPVIYGMTSHSDLFTLRQLVSLDAFSSLVRLAKDKVFHDSQQDMEYADAVATYLAFGISKLADRGSTLSTWDAGYTKIRSTFGRQALSMTWDFAEANPFSGGSGNWKDLLEWTVQCIANWMFGTQGAVAQCDARHGIDQVAHPIVSTDPPYYDNVPYADLSDYFYIWLRRSLAESYSQLMSTLLVPKERELVADPLRQGNTDSARDFFESGMKAVFTSLQSGTNSDAPTTIYYAFKQTEKEDNVEASLIDIAGRSSTGWQTFLQGLSEAGWSIHGTGCIPVLPS